MRRKIRSSVHKLTRRVVRAFTGLNDRDGPEAYLPNTPGSPQTLNPNPGNTPAGPVPSIMADAEEDYSSLPITDRWVHKVRGTRDPTPFRPHGYNKGEAGGGGNHPSGPFAFGGWPVVGQRLDANRTSPGCRSGKSEKEHTKKPPSSSRSAPTSTMPPSSRFCETLPYGKAPSPTATWQHNKMAWQLTAHF